MARGAKPGERRGGRAVGTRNKATVERELIAQEVVGRAKMEGRELAKEVLEKGMKISEGAASAFQPQPDPATGKPSPRDPNWPLFGEWVDRMGFFAKELAKYQSPTFRAIMTAPAPEANPADNRKRFTLNIFDGGRQAGQAEIVPLPVRKNGTVQ